MKNGQTVEKINYRALIVFTGGLIGQIIIFIIGNYAGAIFSVAPIDALIISGIIILMGLICWCIVRVMLHSFLTSILEGRKRGLLKKNDEIGKIVCCTENSSLLCPLNVGFNEYGLTIKINDSTSKEERLFEKEFVYEKEKNGKCGSPWSDIWIFSENLSSEIDPSNNRAEPVLVTNITSNKTKYTIFYLGIESQISEIETRKLAIQNSLSPKDRKLLSFIPIDVNSGYLGKNTLPLLCGSILFSQNIADDKMPIFSEGYLSIRKNNDDVPIYYAIPRCMLREYAKYYKEIIKSNGGLL